MLSVSLLYFVSLLFPHLFSRNSRSLLSFSFLFSHLNQKQVPRYIAASLLVGLICEQREDIRGAIKYYSVSHSSAVEWRVERWKCNDHIAVFESNFITEFLSHRIISLFAKGSRSFCFCLLFIFVFVYLLFLLCWSLLSVSFSLILLFFHTLYRNALY